MKTFLRGSMGCVAAAVLALPGAGLAHGAFTNFGPGFLFDSGSTHATTGQMAMGFVAGATGNVTDLHIGLMGPGTVTIELFGADDDWAQADLLGSWSVSGLPGFGSESPPAHILVSDGPQLFEGGQYWLSVTADQTHFAQLHWGLNVTGGTGPRMLNGQIVDESATQGAFAVIVPAPGALAVLALAGIAAPRRRRQ